MWSFGNTFEIRIVTLYFFQIIFDLDNILKMLIYCCYIWLALAFQYLHDANIILKF